MTYVLITYDRSTEAIEAATVLEEAGVREGVLIPRPRTLTADCGVALRLPAAAAAARALDLLVQAGKLGKTYLGAPRAGWEPKTVAELLSETAEAGRPNPEAGR